jgi:hypothetical protein
MCEFFLTTSEKLLKTLSFHCMLWKKRFCASRRLLHKPPTMSAQPGSAAAAENFTRRAAAE